MRFIFLSGKGGYIIEKAFLRVRSFSVLAFNAKMQIDTAYKGLVFIAKHCAAKIRRAAARNSNGI